MYYKKFLASAATATLVASAIVPAVSAASFTDVKDSDNHKIAIEALVETGIIKGYPDKTFKPYNKLTRGNVVKMLGRWVESQGKTIPTDWNTKQRFKDLPVDFADEELLKYAALVYDNNVFIGSQGNLMHTDNMTRQQMALTLDRAYKQIFGVSLVELAKDVNDKEVLDLTDAIEDRRSEIQALRDLDISIVDKFLPKDTVTRAQFASFLYRTIQVNAPKEEAPQEVKAVSVTSKDSTTLEVVFNKAINAEQENIQKVQVVAKEGTTTPDSLSYQLSEDGKTLTISTEKAFNGEYDVVIESNSVKGKEENEYVSAFTQGVKFEQAAPSVKSAKLNVTTNELEITYSEEIKLVNLETANNDFEVLVNGKSLATKLEIDANKGTEEKATTVTVKLEQLNDITTTDTVSLKVLDSTDIQDLNDHKIIATNEILVSIVDSSK